MPGGPAGSQDTAVRAGISWSKHFPEGLEGDKQLPGSLRLQLSTAVPYTS